MKYLFFLFLYPLLTFGQESVKVVALGEVVEIVSQPREENSDFVTVEIKANQKVIKRFSAGAVIFPQIIGTFNWHDGEYVIYRTDMGAGLCAGGSIYVLKFYDNQSNGVVSGVLVSPVLTTCLGEYPVFGVNFKGKDKFVLSIARHELDLNIFDKWVEIKTPAKNVKKK